MPNEDLYRAERAERLGDAADTPQSAAASYREAQRLLLPVGVLWTDRDAYGTRMEAFERIQRKLYGLAGKSRPAPPDAPPMQPPQAPIPAPAAAPHLSVWDFSPGLTVRIGRAFTDYDGHEVRTGEVLHLLERTYFPYESGHTLRFAEKTIRLAGIVDEHEPIIENAGNAWFQPLP
jgi:hypothetical protein